MYLYRPSIIFAITVIFASVIYSCILLKTNLDVVKSSQTSLILQRINTHELSTSLGNIQLNIKRYSLSRQQSSLDSIGLYQKSFRLQSDSLYRITQQVPELKKYGLLIFQLFPVIMEHENQRIKKLPLKIDLQNVAEIFDQTETPFSTIWKAIDKIRFYQINHVKRSTDDTIIAGSRAWKVSVFGSIFVFLIVLWGIFYIRKNHRNQQVLELKEIASEAKRKENERLLQAVIDNCTSLIFLKDKNYRYTLVNKSFRQLVQLANEEILGRTKEEVFSHLVCEEDISNLEDILNSGKIQETKEHIKCDDVSKYYLTNRFPLYGSDGEIFGLGGISTDITKQKTYENKLMDARKSAEESKTNQQRFLANMSHEIRTPMNGVVGMTNLLDSTVLNAEQQDYVNVIRQSSNILMLLINDILDISKMQAGMLKLEKIPFNIRELITQLYLSYKSMAATNRIELDYEVDQSIPEFLSGDPLRLTQIISNLISNAIKFTPAGSVRFKVWGEETAPNLFSLKVAVADTGIGIPADRLDHVFESFTQSSISTTRKFGGTGLGLSIVKELVEMQNGSISLASKQNVGSTFTVTMPFSIVFIQHTQQPKTSDIKNFSSLKNKKILVVEDNLINRKVAQQILLKAGIEVVDLAEDGFKAIEMLQNTSYDAVLMDVQMPEISGLETTKHIREKLKLNVPIIALTASALPEDRENCFTAGMNDYITKPFLPEDLLKKLSFLI